jgi:hypothetical protein
MTAATIYFTGLACTVPNGLVGVGVQSSEMTMTLCIGIALQRHAFAHCLTRSIQAVRITFFLMLMTTCKLDSYW